MSKWSSSLSLMIAISESQSYFSLLYESEETLFQHIPGGNPQEKVFSLFSARVSRNLEA